MIMHGPLKNISSFLEQSTTPFGLFALSYSIYCALFYLVSSPFVVSAFFLILVMPSFIRMCHTHSRIMALRLQTFGCRIALGFVAYSAVIDFFSTSSLWIWSEKSLIPSLEIATFFLASVTFFIYLPKAKVRLFLTCVSVIGGIGALLSITLYIATADSLVVRLSPIGRAHHPILGALVYGVCGLISLYLSFTASHIRERILSGAVSLLIGILILLTGSRAPIAAYSVSVLLSIWSYAQKENTLLPRQARGYLMVFSSISGLIFIGFFLIHPLLNQRMGHSTSSLSFSSVGRTLHTYINEITERGTSLRPALWEEAWKKIQEKPYLGHGIHARISLTPSSYASPSSTQELYHIHNLFFGALFHVGIPGAFLFYIYLLWALKQAVQQYLSTHPFCILASILFFFSVLSGIFDLSYPIKPPGPLWIILWFPLAFLTANQVVYGKAISTTTKKVKKL